MAFSTAPKKTTYGTWLFFWLAKKSFFLLITLFLFINLSLTCISDNALLLQGLFSVSYVALLYIGHHYKPRIIPLATFFRWPYPSYI